MSLSFVETTSIVLPLLHAYAPPAGSSSLSSMGGCAGRDPLTDLANRSKFLHHLISTWRRVQSGEGSLALVVADVIQLQRINETYGRPIGDKVLHAVAQAIAAQCRSTDLVARYGDDEFAIILRNTFKSGAEVFAKRCRDQIASLRIRAGEAVVCVGARFGVADYTTVSTPIALVEMAARSLRDATNGRCAARAKKDASRRARQAESGGAP